MPRLVAAVVVLLKITVAAATVRADGDAPLVALEGLLAFPDRAATAAGDEVLVTGLSGVSWLGGDEYVAVMDNSDCLVRFALDVEPSGAPRRIRDVRVVRLEAVHDYEDVAPCPAALRDHIAAKRRAAGDADPGACILVCEEDTPAIRAVGLDSGRLLGIVPLPDLLAQRRPNRGLESVAVDPDDGRIWTATEEAVPADGPAAATGSGTVVRLVGIAVPGGPAGPAVVQCGYAVAAPHAFVRVIAGEPLAGVTALVPLGAGRLLVLERSAGPGLPPFVSRIVLVDTTTAADVSDVPGGLADRGDLHLARRLLWEEAIGCNLEGLCIGPRRAAGGRVLVGIADNGGLGTPNQLVALSLAEPVVTSP